jgi:hypothetical protein
MKRALLTIAMLLAIRVSTSADDLIVDAPAGNPITMTGSAIRLVPNPNTAPPMLCSSILIQSQPGSTNPIYVLNAAPNVTMSKGGAGTSLVATLGPGTSTQPGQSITYPSNGAGAVQGSYADLRYWGVSGTASDTVTAVCAIRQ